MAHSVHSRFQFDINVMNPCRLAKKLQPAASPEGNQMSNPVRHMQVAEKR